MDGMNFIRQKGNYEDLLCYKKALCVYDVTYYFAHKYLQKGDRTIDQMVQAARSGKQNIVEGCAASTTSAESEIKLLNVAKASLQELLEDYKDYLRVRGLQQWSDDCEKHEQARRACAAHNEPGYYSEAIKERSDETIANIAIILIKQTDYLLKHYFDRIKQDFLENGGIREEMTRGRLQWSQATPFSSSACETERSVLTEGELSPSTMIIAESDTGILIVAVVSLMPILG